MIKTVLIVSQIAFITAVAYNGDPDTFENTLWPLPIVVQDYVTQVTPVVDTVSLHCLAQNIYFEARNQGQAGMLAVANVTLNRVSNADFPDEVCAVVQQGPLDGSEIRRNRCQFSWFCSGKVATAPVNDNYLEVQAWDQSVEIAALSLLGQVDDNTNGGTYYHANYVSPNWSTHFKQVAVIGEHIFYVHKW